MSIGADIATIARHKTANFVFIISPVYVGTAFLSSTHTGRIRIAAL
jgi:hypothetical protein